MSAPQIVTVQLAPGEVQVVTRPIVGNGGHQGLLRRMVARLNRTTGTMDVLPQDVARARTYAGAYGNGGYQDRFRIIIAAVDRTVGRLP